MKKFIVAFKGLKEAWFDKSIRVQMLFALAAVIVGLMIGFDTHEWALVMLMIGLVISAEIFNTCIERLCDLVQPDFDPKIKYIKDLSSAAVLVAAMSALASGLLIVMSHR